MTRPSPPMIAGGPSDLNETSEGPLVPSDPAARVIAPYLWRSPRPSLGVMAMTLANTLDLRGLVRPRPLERTCEELGRLKTGDLLEVVTTDDSSIQDFTT